MKHIYRIFIILFAFMWINVSADFTYTRGNIALGHSNVYLRTCASTSCSPVKDDENKTVSISYPEMFEVIDETSDFYKINLQYGGFWYQGWIKKGDASDPVSNVKAYSITDAKVNEIVNRGFPNDYALKIAVMETVHPNWDFKVFNVGRSFQDVIAGETKYISTNLIDGKNTSLRSTADGAYVDGAWTTFEGGAWYAASAQTIKYYVDPRNFLNDGHVFMFENLAFDENIQTADLMQSLLNGTFMSGNAFYYDDAGNQVPISYAQTFVDAGRINLISSVHLVSRVIQEQGSGGSPLSAGTHATYPGYYNFFNIKANGSTPVATGLAYAQKKGWNSPYKAIIEGASTLQNYMSYGQVNLYLQKFDFAGDTFYSTQYMQNVRAPYSESYTAYRAYAKNNYLDTKFTFLVPVFTGNMPAVTSLDANYNEDATLSALSVTGCNLMPSFTSSATNYTCSVLKSVSEVNVSAAATNAQATVNGTGIISIPNDTNELKVVVTSAAGSANTYTITVEKIDESEFTPDDILSRLSISIKNNYISGFTYQSDFNSLNNLILTNYPQARIENSYSQILATGMKLDLSNKGAKSYEIVIYGDNNGDGIIDILDLLKVQKDILNVNKLNGAYKEASDVNKDGVIDILDLLKVQKDILGVKKIEQ